MEKLQFQDFEAFAAFDQEVLKEIIREGEVEMNARLLTANASDRRSQSLFGFQISATLALAGAGFAAISDGGSFVPLGIVAFIIATSLMIGAFIALESVRPTLYCFPGNDPKNWRLDQWHFNLSSYGDATLTKAMVEQCVCLHRGLFDNRRDMEAKSEKYRLSIDITIFSALASIVLILLALLLMFLYSV